MKNLAAADSWNGLGPTFQTPDALLQGVQIHGSSRAMQLHAPLLTKKTIKKLGPNNPGQEGYSGQIAQSK